MREAKALGEKPIFIEVHATQEIINDRLSRPRDFSDADYPVYLQLTQEFEPLERDHLILKSTNENIHEMLETALDYLKTISKNLDFRAHDYH